jgi:RNase P subunit RPR2
MSFYLLFFLLIVSIGIVISYIYFMKEKKANLMAIEQGVCPKCHKPTIEIIDQRSTGCSGPKMITFECKECKYHSVYHISDANSCGSGRCGT